MGLFSNPDCPECGRETEETGWCAPYAAYRCPHCIRENSKAKEAQDRISELEKRIAQLEQS